MKVTCIRAELTKNERKQRRLAGAISARDADFLTRMDLKAGIAKQQTRSAADSNVVKVLHGGEVYVLRTSVACVNPRAEELSVTTLKGDSLGFKLRF